MVKQFRLSGVRKREIIELARTEAGAVMVELPAATVRSMELASRISGRSLREILTPVAHRITQAVEGRDDG